MPTFAWRDHQLFYLITRTLMVSTALVVLAGCCGLTEPLAELIPNPFATATPAPAPTRSERPKVRDAPEIVTRPEPIPTATPVPEPLAVVEQGFGQHDHGLGYGFLIENPNPTLAVALLPYEIALFDADGKLAGTDSGYVQRILPGETLGVASTMGLDEGVTVAEIEVRLSQGTFNALDPVPGFAAERVVFEEGPYRDSASGVVLNPLPTSFTEVRVSAIPYNEDGSIIGGGFAYLNFVLADDVSGVTLSLTKDGEIASVVFYPTVSGLTSVGDDEPLPDGAEAAAVTTSGYGQHGRSVGYGLLVENPNTSLLMESMPYRVTAYDAEGYVLATDQGTIAQVLPGRTLGVGGGLTVGEGDVVDRLEAQVLTGDLVEADGTRHYPAEDATYHSSDYTDRVTGWVQNPYDDGVSDLRVFAIAYDRRGAIIGGGNTFLDFVRAGHSGRVEVNITTDSPPAAVELYACLSVLSEFR
jgi:hypothetical protein